MILGNFKIEDLAKTLKTLSMSRNPITFNASLDGPKLLISWVGDDGKLVCVTLFPSEINNKPTITKTDYL
jgi:hypothetical protein